ncbi:DedA family protein [Helicobacter sp. faydin-H20]|uniref:DedA family protein n=1 Tax=Helicobacter anatolicus TaxID=2905874 RepID=UPI001E59CC21|nr:DedA family protein [Helicobacter anatolicus]
MEAIQMFQENLQTWGYLLVFVYSLGGGYVAIVAAGFLCSMGKMDISLSILLAFLGNAIGTNFFALMVRMQKKDFEKYLKKHKRKVALAFLWLKKYGIGLILFSKYLYGIKTIVPIAIGVSRYKLKKFYFFNTLACLVWAISVGLVSFFAANFFQNILDKLSFLPTYTAPVLFIILMLVILGALKIYGTKKS